MKALPMLDHVMLWLARGFASLLIAGACLNVLQSLTPHPPGPEINPADVSVMEMVVTCLLGISLWKAWNHFSRTFVLFISVSTLLIAIFVLNTFDPGEMSDRDAELIRSFYGTLIAGFGCVLWSACRPRNNTRRPISPNVTDRPPLPQSS